MITLQQVLAEALLHKVQAYITLVVLELLGKEVMVETLSTRLAVMVAVVVVAVRLLALLVVLVM